MVSKIWILFENGKPMCEYHEACQTLETQVTHFRDVAHKKSTYTKIASIILTWVNDLQCAILMLSVFLLLLHSKVFYGRTSFLPSVCECPGIIINSAAQLAVVLVHIGSTLGGYWKQTQIKFVSNKTSCIYCVNYLTIQMILYLWI